MKKYFAEFIGTFTLTIAVTASILTGGGFPTYLIAGMVLGLFVVSIGNISGTHINPAVTIGLLVHKKITKEKALGYILAQCAGSLFALLVTQNLSMRILSLPTEYSSVSLFAEIIGMAIFSFGIASVVFNEDNKKNAPFVIGGSLAIGALVAGALGSNGVLNPAVALGIGSFGISYLLGPILGSVIGILAYKKIN